jgi:hypothetical protein
MTNINFNRDNVKQFIQLYNRATKDKKDSFMFQDGEFLTKYAYYLIQHLVNEKIAKGKFNEGKVFMSAK